ncbi:MAG: FtsW/RodA/SpoVE family cell cycle protein [Fimbriimonadaceae bacterium]|nr:FtsW/RodA/SpoVE family cell cycle protein [Chthonomonadaceae bacterium]MCO5297605.1 FtsW/RodA/SpoVE family cell cycle protein [Fimbriimonadaceae bacterium]
MIGKVRIYDGPLFVLAAIATGVGLVFIFDAGYARSLLLGNGAIPREFRTQLMFVPVALLAGALASRIGSDTWRTFSKLLWVATLVALVAPMMPGIGIERNGAHRWIGIGPFEVQPAEFAKLAAIVYLAGVFAGRPRWPAKTPRFKTRAQYFDSVVVPKTMRMLPAIWVLLAVVLIETEPDLGTAAVVAATAFAMFVAGGASRKTLLVGGLLAVVGVGVLVAQQPYRIDRILVHRDRWSAKNLDDTAYQTVQSEMAMATGGLVGVGIGAGRAKHVLPAATTDFVTATVFEEFGLAGALAVIALIGAFVMRLLVLAPRAATPFGSLVLVGVASWIGIQSCVNIMMANGMLPAIGIPLPFVSSGGSSLVALWLAVGICQSMLAPQVAKEGKVAAGRHRWRNRRTRLSRA